jgi:hypothetical protein
MSSSHQPITISTKPAAYAYSIAQLSLLAQEVPEAVARELKVLTEKLKIAFENHEQDIQYLVAELKAISEKHAKVLIKLHISTIENVSNVMHQSDLLKPTLKERFSNPFQRRFESEFAINLLFNPTNAMMDAVGHISQRILACMAINGQAFQHVITQSALGTDVPERLGCYPGKLTDAVFKNILKENKKEDLATIMLIHYNFAFYAKNLVMQSILQVNFLPWTNPPSGYFATFVQEKLEKYTVVNGAGYIDILNDPKYQRSEVPALPDEHLSGSLLYRDKGRKGIRNFNAVHNRLGLMLMDQDAEDFIKLAADKKLLPWVPDLFAQKVDFESAYVKSMLANDCVFVCGPSGLTSLLMANMEITGNLPDTLAKQRYLTAALGFIVAGGFHSMHEVLGPAQYGLQLIPGYHADPPLSQNNYPMKATNYNAFFSLFKEDKEFQQVRKKTWNDFICRFVTRSFELNVEKIQDVNAAATEVTKEKMSSEEKEFHADEKEEERLIRRFNKL